VDGNTSSWPVIVVGVGSEFVVTEEAAGARAIAQAPWLSCGGTVVSDADDAVPVVNDDGPSLAPGAVGSELSCSGEGEEVFVK
jgi:hypothetical protein